MTERLYRYDAYATTFTSEVLEVREEVGGHALLLARTLFYPTAGGQPHDLGTLTCKTSTCETSGGKTSASLPVLDVCDEGGGVWHRVGRTAYGSGGEAPAPGDVVEGRIDWPRRYRHMQRHSGQHLLSQAFVRVDPALTTEAVSLSGPACTLDLAGGLGEAELEAAERLANEAAYANDSVEAFEVPADEVARYPLRRPPKVSGPVRLVRMGDWELSACGGTHLRRTAEAAPVKLLRLERIKAGLARVHFRCGWEAVEDYALKHRLAYGLATSLSAGVEEVPARVAALQAALAQAERDVGALQARLAAALAVRLLAQAEPGPYGRVVSHTLSPEDADLLKPLAQALVQEDDVIALLAGVQPGRVQFLFARGAAVSAQMNGVLASALPFVGGRGGGKPELAQGGGSRPEGAAEALAHVRAQLLL